VPHDEHPAVLVRGDATSFDILAYLRQTPRRPVRLNQNLGWLLTAGGPAQDLATCRSQASAISSHFVTVKLELLVAVPPGAVTEIGPVLEPFGTVAEIVVAEITLKVLAAVPENLTAVAPVKFVPVMVTTVFTRPLVGKKTVIVGAAVTVKTPALVAVPPGVTMLIGPLLAPLGTVAVICDAPLALNDVAATPLKSTAVAPDKLLPLIVTDVPATPVVGEKLEIVGGAPTVTVKFAVLVAVPVGVTTRRGPVVAPAGTVAVICVGELTT
jgi:hypothetical protein